MELGEADGPAGPPGRSRCARRVHAPDPVRRRPRNHPTADPRSHADSHDARPAVRPDDRIGCAQQARILLGRQPRRRLAASAARRGGDRRGRVRSRSKSTVTRPWPTPTPPAPAACRPRSFGAIAGSDLASVNPNIKFVPCPFTGESLACVPALRPDVAIVHAQRADRAATCSSRGSSACRKRPCSSARRALVTVEEVVDRFEGVGTNAVILPSWVVGADRGRAGRRPSVVRARILRSRQRLLPRVGRDLARSRSFQAWMREHVLDAAPDVFRSRAYDR